MNHFFNSARTNYGLFVTGAENFAARRLGNMGPRQKWGASNAPVPQRELISKYKPGTDISVMGQTWNTCGHELSWHLKIFVP